MSILQASTQLQLRQFIEQIERLEEEKKAIASDIKDKFLEAKANGFDVKAMRTIISMRKKPSTQRQEEESILEVYMHALGMLADTPLGEWAQEQEQDAGAEMTISLNGGPPQPMSVVKEVVQLVKREKRAKGRMRGHGVELPEGAEA